jgi:hypothetical protein
MSLISDLLHPELSEAHCPSSSDFMDPDVLYLFPGKYGLNMHTVKTLLDTTLIKRLRDIFLRLRKDFGDGLKYKVVYAERLRLILRTAEVESILDSTHPFTYPDRMCSNKPSYED